MQATVFFDLDETLLHSVPWSQFGPVEPTKRTDPVITVDKYTYTVMKRPGIDRILGDIEHAGHRLFIFTAADPVYADAALKSIKLRDYFDFVFSTRDKVPAGRTSFWYLFDDTSAELKLHYLNQLGEGRLVRVPAFRGWDAKPIPVPPELLPWHKK